MNTFTETAWLFDILPQKDHIIMYWITDTKKTIKCYFRQVNASIYAYSSTATRLLDIAKGIGSHPLVIDVKLTKKRVSIHDIHYTTVLEISIPLYANKQTFIKEIRDIFPVTFFNVDLSNFQYFYHKTGLFPFCKARISFDQHHHIQSITLLDKLTQFDYELPPVKAIQINISFNNPIKKSFIKKVTITSLDSKLDGSCEKNKIVLQNTSEAQLILETVRWIEKHNIDILVTHGGDTDFRFFASRAAVNGLGHLSFSRETHMDQFYRVARHLNEPKGTSFMSYGGHFYKAHGYYLYGGRHHIDLRNSFTWNDGGFAGIVELARLSCIDAQHCARTTIGTTLTGMQIRQALTWNILIPSRKADAERFRSGETLIVGDRGGFIYSPRVGLHFNVAAIDFSSMFPNIMVKHNISPETVNCKCCNDGTGKPIPSTSWYTCQERKGLIPLVLKTVLEKRLFYKQFKKTNKSYDQLQKTLKWILVTCFEENTLLPVFIDGKLKLVRIGPFIDGLINNRTDAKNLYVIGMDESKKTLLNPIRRAYRLPSPLTLLHIQVKNGTKLIVTKDHICYVLLDGKLIEKRAEDVKKGDLVPFLPQLVKISEQYENKKNLEVYSTDLMAEEVDFTEVIQISQSPTTSAHVYCLEVADQLHGFFAGTGGIFTHNCFGYQGYRNARFGRIEAHEAINAYARYSLLVSGEAIQNRGFEIVAGIVDSLWGKLPNEGKIDASIIKDICQEIEEKTDLPIDHEGTFKWIVFLPRRHEPEVGVLNRYYGCFEDGSFKVRGIELRRRDTCEFIKSAQAEALEVLASATNKEEFYELLIGKYWDVHEKYDTMLRNREVPVEQLFIKKVIAKEPSQYAMAVHQAIAAQQLARSGVHLQSGMKVSYLVTDSTAKSTNKRVIASVLYKGQKPYDLKWYQKMLKEAFDNIIPPSFTPEHPTSLKLERFTSLMNIN